MQVELTQMQMNAVERTHAGVEHRILLAPFGGNVSNTYYSGF